MLFDSSDPRLVRGSVLNRRSMRIVTGVKLFAIYCTLCEETNQQFGSSAAAFKIKTSLHNRD